jgi:hypothetical protein
MVLTDYIGIGGPVGIVFMFFGFLLNAYIAKRKDNREDVKIERESESGIVETTRAALAMAREEMKATNLTRNEDREEYRDGLARLRAEKDTEIDVLRIKVAGLQAENERLRKGEIL